MAAGKYNITIYQGSDFSLQLTVKEGTVAKNLTGYSVRAQLRTTVDASATAATFTGSITNAAGGILKIDMPYGTTAGLTSGQYYYDLEIYTGSVVQRLVQGTATVRGEVTR